MSSSPVRYPRTPLGRLAMLVTVQLAISTAFMSYFTRVFDYGERVILLHISVITAIIAAVTAVLVLIRPLLSQRVARVVTALVPGSAFCLLAMLYGADLLSNRSWGHNVSYELTARYAFRPLELAGYVTVTGGWLTVIAAALAAAGGAIVLMRTRTITDAVAAVLERLQAPRTRVTTLVALSVSVALPAGAGYGMAQSVNPAARLALLEREPVIGFFIDGESAHQFALSRIATRYRDEGPAMRTRYPKSQPFDRRNVIVIVVDSLRADHMQTYGYERPTTPFLSRLVNEGSLRQVDMALATCPDSNCGISSILASKTFGSLVPQNFKLHELLRDQGYQSYFLLSGDHDWIGMNEFYGSEIDLYFEGHSSRRFHITDDRMLFEGLEQVPDFSGTPAFLFFHLMSVHEVGVRLDPYVVYQPSRPNFFWGGDREMRVNSYDNGVRQADAIIEQLFAALEEKGYLDRGIVVITSDHGEGLGERPGKRGFGHGALLYQPFLRIPLLILDDVPYGNLQYATHVDIAPTIVHRLGLPRPASWEGRSLLEPEIKTHSVHYMDRGLSTNAQSPFYAVVQRTPGGMFKYISQPQGEELFNLSRDPQEQRNLLNVEQGDDVVREIRSRLADALAGLRGDRPGGLVTTP